MRSGEEVQKGVHYHCRESSELIQCELNNVRWHCIECSGEQISYDLCHNHYQRNENQHAIHKNSHLMLKLKKYNDGWKTIEKATMEMNTFSDQYRCLVS